ncbi:MAG: YqhA family protein, partial [Alphaproteobacteria bacterium]|nr:YqhA family protein [Alphaproteobacteria bacterium]
GYENFVSKIDAVTHEDWPDWKGSVDFATLKLKLIASIVAISGIHLLKVFMDIDKIPQNQAIMMVAIHLTFVISGVLMALMDRISTGTKLAKGK